MRISVCAVPAWPAIGLKNDQEPKMLSAAGKTVRLEPLLAKLSSLGEDIHSRVRCRPIGGIRVCIHQADLVTLQGQEAQEAVKLCRCDKLVTFMHGIDTNIFVERSLWRL